MRKKDKERERKVDNDREIPKFSLLLNSMALKRQVPSDLTIRCCLSALSLKVCVKESKCV